METKMKSGVFAIGPGIWLFLSFIFLLCALMVECESVSADKEKNLEPIPKTSNFPSQNRFTLPKTNAEVFDFEELPTEEILRSKRQRGRGRGGRRVGGRRGGFRRGGGRRGGGRRGGGRRGGRRG